LAAASAGLGFLSKYTIVFIVAGFTLSIAFFRLNILKRKGFWISVAAFLIIISPNVIWQIRNGMPVFSHFSKLYETQLNRLSMAGELKNLILYLNPLASPFWITGLLVVPFLKRNKVYILYTFTLLFAFFLLLLAKGKSYYFFPVILGVLPGGDVIAEKLLADRKWILYTYFVFICIFGLYLLPHGVPVLSLDNYLKTYHLSANEDGKIPLPFENFYTKPIWNEIMAKVGNEYHNLTPEEQRHCLIWGRHYSQAGIIDLYRRKYDLPKAISFHSSFYNWVPEFDTNTTFITISDSNLKEEYWHQYFNEVTAVGTIENKYTDNYKWYTHNIFICRKLKFDSSDLKKLFLNEVF
jgi:hypothetical protein